MNDTSKGGSYIIEKDGTEKRVAGTKPAPGRQPVKPAVSRQSAGVPGKPKATAEGINAGVPGKRQSRDGGSNKNNVADSKRTASRQRKKSTRKG